MNIVCTITRIHLYSKNRPDNFEEDTQELIRKLEQRKDCACCGRVLLIPKYVPK